MLTMTNRTANRATVGVIENGKLMLPIIGRVERSNEMVDARGRPPDGKP